MTRRFIGWLWLLSGVPVGLALVVLPPWGQLALFTVFVALETGHSLSPIALAWTHHGFRRQLILKEPWKYIVLPTTIFGITFAVGAATSLGWTSLVYGGHNEWLVTDWTNPLPVVVWIYWAWNAYHFGGQHYGVGRLLGWMPDRELVIAATMVLMLWVPIIVPTPKWWGLFVLGAVSANHWIVDIGLSGRVSQWGWLLVLGLLAAGCVGFVWEKPTAVGPLTRIIPVIICARFGLGFVHFLYSKWVWQLSDPRVRTAIGV